jgi:hypothetical protein
MKIPGARGTFALAVVAVMLVASGSGGGSSANADGSAPVTVVNAPLPVRLTGTGTISGVVSAQQAGAWNVGVTSLPAVQLAPGTTVGITGSIANDDARNAFAAELCVDAGAGCGEPVTIPVNKRFVIEQVSGRRRRWGGTSSATWPDFPCWRGPTRPATGRASSCAGIAWGWQRPPR